MADYQPELDRIYRRDIEPHAAALEESRQARVKALYRNIALSVVVIGLLAGAAYFFGFYKTHTIWVVVAAVLACIGTFAAINHPIRKHREAVKDLVIPPVCALFGDMTYERNPKRKSVGVERYRDTGIVGNFNRCELEDRFVGHHRDTAYQMVEARLKRRRNSGKQSSSRTLFKGLLFDIEVPQKFNGFLIMVGDKGTFGNAIISFIRKQFRGLERYETGNPEFEALYEVYCDNLEDARGLLAPGFLETMVALSKQIGRAGLNGAMVDGRFLLTLPHDKDLFEIGKLHRPLTQLEEDVRDLVTQITIPHRVIDYLHGDRPKLMP